MKKRILFSMLCVPLAGITMATVPFLTSCNKAEQPSTPVEEKDSLSNISLETAKKFFGEANVVEDTTNNVVKITGFNKVGFTNSKTLMFPGKINYKLIEYSETFKTELNSFMKEVWNQQTNTTNIEILELYIGDQQAFDLISDKIVNRDDISYKPTPLSKTIQKLVVAGEVRRIPFTSLQYSKQLKTLEIGGKVEYIEQNAFSSCELLEYVKFNYDQNTRNEVWINSHAFYNCLALKEIDFGNVDSFLRYGFEGNDGSLVAYRPLVENVKTSTDFWSAWWLFEKQKITSINIKCKDSLKAEFEKIAKVGNNNISQLKFLNQNQQ